MLIGLNEATGMLTCSIIERILVKDYLKLFKVNWNRILPNDDPWIVLNSFNLAEPLVLTDLGRCVSFCWICVENLLQEVTAVITDKFGYGVIGIQNFLV